MFSAEPGACGSKADHGCRLRRTASSWSRSAVRTRWAKPGTPSGEARAEDHCALHGDGLVTFRAGDGTPDTLLVCGQISASYEGALGLFELFQAPMIESFPSNSALHASFEAMMAEVATPSLGTQAMTELLMKQCLIVLLRRQLLEPGCRIAHAEGACRSRSSLAPSWQCSKIRLLPTRSRAWRHLARMSRTAFAERFSHVFGQGPMDFVQRVRLRIAARLLTATDLPVKSHRQQHRLREPQRVQPRFRGDIRVGSLGFPQFRRAVTKPSRSGSKARMPGSWRGILRARTRRRRCRCSIVRTTSPRVPTCDHAGPRLRTGWFIG